MNDTELDQLLNTWEAPMPPRTLRSDLRGRFPRAERRWFGRPLRWVLVGIVACATLAVGMQQTGYSNPAAWLFERIRGACEAFVFGLEAYDASALMVRIRDSQSKIYLDGQLQPAPEVWRGAQMRMHVPGEADYAVMLVGGIKGFTEAGRVHGNVMEFQAGSHHVRVECNRQVTDSDRPVFVRRDP